MAKAKGANVIGTCSSKEKAEIAKMRGCDFVIITKSDDATDDDDVWPQLPEMVAGISFVQIQRTQFSHQIVVQ